MTYVGVRQHTQDVCVTSVGVRQYTPDIRGCPCVSVCVRLCPSAHIGHPWLSISTHISTLVLGLRTLALPVDCLGDFGTRGLYVQYTHDVRGCLPAHTARRLWVSASTHRTYVADVRVCPFVPVSTHWTSVAVHQYTYQHVGPWTQHAGPSRGLFGTHRTSVCVLQHTQDVHGCPWLAVSTQRTSMTDIRGCPCVSVCVRQHTQDVPGCQSVHISARWSLDSAPWPFSWTVWVILAHVGCLFSTHRTSYTQDVRGCPPVHTGHPWLSVCVRHTQDVCGCPCVSVCVCDVYDCPCVSVSTHRTSMGVRQHTQDVCVCSVNTHRTSVAVHVCLCVSVSTHRTSVAVNQYTYQHVGPWTQHPGASRGLTSVAVHQYTYQHAGPWTQHAGPSRGLFDTHRTSMAVHQYTYQHVGPWTPHAGPSRGLFG
ncbi:unnamed protein product, partial [Brassica rapa]